MTGLVPVIHAVDVYWALAVLEKDPV